MVSHVDQCKCHCEYLERGNVPLRKVLKRSRLEALAECYHTPWPCSWRWTVLFLSVNFSCHGDAVHRQRYADCHRTAVTDFVMMVDSMDMGTTDLSAEAGLDESGMGRSTTDTAGLELTELAH